MDLSGIESKLGEEFQYGRSPNERRDQIPSIMDSLKKSAEDEGGLTS
jgi:hypothetical protein